MVRNSAGCTVTGGGAGGSMGEEGDACQDGLMAGISPRSKWPFQWETHWKIMGNVGNIWKKKHVKGGFTGKIWENYLEMEMFHSQI